MDAANTPTLADLTTEVQDVALLVHQAQERSDERDVVAAAHAGVDRMSQRYRAMLQSLPPAEQMKAERLLGRRVVDIKRLASLLPKVPAANTESTPDRVEKYSEAIKRVSTSMQVPSPEELAKLYGFENAEALEADWIAWMGTGAFK